MYLSDEFIANEGKKSYVCWFKLQFRGWGEKKKSWGFLDSEHTQHAEATVRLRQASKDQIQWVFCRRTGSRLLRWVYVL